MPLLRSFQNAARTNDFRGRDEWGAPAPRVRFPAPSLETSAGGKVFDEGVEHDSRGRLCSPNFGGNAGWPPAKTFVATMSFWTAGASEARPRFGEGAELFDCATPCESAVAAALCRRSPRRQTFAGDSRTARSVLGRGIQRKDAKTPRRKEKWKTLCVFAPLR
jgi:hypothetical protein